jgi:hypothetical protein
MGDREITAKLQAALLKSYPLPEYATFFEVGDATGGRHSRWADAVSMACWPSRGLRIWGFELKASRSDWLREKKKPEKSCAIQRFCHHWVLVTAPDVILPGELPETWGHLVLKGGKLCWEALAPTLTPDALDPSFVAALLRRSGQASQEIIGQHVDAATAAARERVKDEVSREVERRTSRNAQAVTAIEQFKVDTGVDLLTSWGHWSGDVGKDFAAYCAAREASAGLFRYGTSVKALRAAADAIEAAERALGETDLMRKEATA